jgi:hypothetical protein
MKPHHFILLSISALLVGCSPKALTDDRARKALEQFAAPGTVSFSGVQEIPQFNSAGVNLTLTNFRYKSGDTTLTYSGPASATFTHYTDGRWVLSQVNTESQGMTVGVQFSPNIEVK